MQRYYAGWNSFLIDYKVFRFASAPRTGTVWFRKVCATAGLGELSAAGVHIPHTPRGGVLTVSLIRHPIDWAESYWHALRGGHTAVTAVDVFAPLARDADCVGDFLAAYLAQMPGAIGEMFDSYNADVVLRLGDMPWAMFGFLRSAGVSKKMARKAVEIPPQNRGRGEAAIIESGMRRRIMIAESEFCQEYGYW